jgi:hypothetical protein
MLAERGWDAQNERIDFSHTGKIARRLQIPANELRDPVGADMFDVRSSALQRFHLRPVDVESYDAIPDLAVAKHQRKTNIAKPDDADGCRFVGKLFDKP